MSLFSGFAQQRLSKSQSIEKRHNEKQDKITNDSKDSEEKEE